MHHAYAAPISMMGVLCSIMLGFHEVPVTFATIETPVSYSTSFPVAQDVPPVVVKSTTKIVAKPVAVEAVQKAPEARLIIPSIKVNAAIKEMGYTAEGAMALPDNRTDTGWFSPGTRPGNIGSAVIGGHNEWANGAGVFANLHTLKAGDVLSVVDAKGVSTSFVVREMRTYNPTDHAGEIFNSPGGIHLNLITCSGIFDPSTQTYSHRLVVFTEMVDQLALGRE